MDKKGKKNGEKRKLWKEEIGTGNTILKN